MLNKAHFQLTGCCNLACRFCGQHKGMLACDDGDTVTFDDWLRVGEELRHEAAAGGSAPQVMLWGGEPLLWPRFSELARELYGAGIRLGVVTNGTLIDRHAGALNECFDEIYLSLDGDETMHDLIRGEGTFRRIAANVPLLAKRRGRLILMTTLSDDTIGAAPELPGKLGGRFRPDGWVFGQLIYVFPEEIDRYRRIAAEIGQPEYPELAAWSRSEDAGYLARLRAAERKLRALRAPFPIHFVPHHYPEGRFGSCHCPAVDHRLHIRHDGECGVCTDYFGFSLGNIHRHSLGEIFRGERASRLRAFLHENRMPICDHCPWLGQAEKFGF